MKRSLQITSCALWLFVAGCGTDLSEALFFAGESAGRTFLDVLISDFYSDAPELVIFPGGPGDSTDVDDAAEDDATVAEPDDPELPDSGEALDVTGDAERGVTVYEANFCAACHCDDASGGCLPSAPDLRGRSLMTLQEKLQGDAPHVGGAFPDLTAQDIADLQTFLAQ